MVHLFLLISCGGSSRLSEGGDPLLPPGWPTCTTRSMHCFFHINTNSRHWFPSVQSGIHSVPISLQLSQTFSRLLPWGECPCTSRKPKSDRLWKSLGCYLEKVPPQGSLNLNLYQSVEKPRGLSWKSSPSDMENEPSKPSATRVIFLGPGKILA